MSTRDILLEIAKFFVLYGFVYLIYLIFTSKRRKNFDSNKASQEVKFLVTRFNLDFRKVDYKKFMRAVLAYNSFVIAFVFMSTTLLDKMIYKIILAFILMVPLVLFGYNLIGNYFKKKGDK